MGLGAESHTSDDVKVHTIEAGGIRMILGGEVRYKENARLLRVRVAGDLRQAIRNENREGEGREGKGMRDTLYSTAVAVRSLSIRISSKHSRLLPAPKCTMWMNLFLKNVFLA